MKKRLGKKILGIYLFGSTAKGTSAQDTDIDVLIVYTGLAERRLLEITSDISFNIVLSSGESIETVIMTKKEYEKELGRSPFLWEVLTFGKPVFTTLTSYKKN